MRVFAYVLGRRLYERQGALKYLSYERMRIQLARHTAKVDCYLTPKFSCERFYHLSRIVFARRRQQTRRAINPTTNSRSSAATTVRPQARREDLAPRA